MCMLYSSIRLKGWHLFYTGSGKNENSVKEWQKINKFNITYTKS